MEKNFTQTYKKPFLINLPSQLHEDLVSLAQTENVSVTYLILTFVADGYKNTAEKYSKGEEQKKRKRSDSKPIS